MDTGPRKGEGTVEVVDDLDDLDDLDDRDDRDDLGDPGSETGLIEAPGRRPCGYPC